jgi:HSP20 family protein
MLPALRNTGALAPTPANRLTSLFDDLFTPFAAPAWAGQPLTMWEDADAVHVEMDAPGIAAGDIDLSVQDGVLTVQGERKCESKDALYEGRCYGRFAQRVTLPAAVDADRVEATLASGVLKVTLPKTPESKPKKIAVRAE